MIEPTFSSKFAADLIAYAAEHGANRASLTALTHLPPGAMNREDIRIPCSTMARVWMAAIKQTGDESLAMNLGISRFFGANRTTSLIMEASSTVLESFQLAAHYSVLIADVMTVEIGEADDILYVEFQPKPAWRAQPKMVQLDCLAITYVAAVSSIKRLLGTHHPPSLLSLTFASPANVMTWFEIFDGSIDFKAQANRIGFPADLKSRAVASGDPGLKAAIRHYADELIATFGGQPQVTRQVMDAIVQGMAPQPPSLAAVARSLSKSARSLQRQLKAEGHTYRSLVEQVRMDLSERYLRGSERTLDEIAYLTGYTDTASFVRAFKRSKGLPPRRFAKTRP